MKKEMEKQTITDIQNYVVDYNNLYHFVMFINLPCACIFQIWCTVRHMCVRVKTKKQKHACINVKHTDMSINMLKHYQKPNLNMQKNTKSLKITKVDSLFVSFLPI